MATITHTISLKTPLGRMFVLTWEPGNELLAMQELIRWLADPEIPFFVPHLQLFADRIYATIANTISD